jgi:hypothetical protein
MSTRSSKWNMKLSALLLAAAIALFAPQAAMATGTASGTTISNSATVNFQVGGLGQTPVTSAAATFVVDNKVNLTVVANDAGAVTTTPGGTSVLKYTVTNNGNTVQDYALSYVASGTNTFAASTVNIYADVNGNGTYEAGTDTATYIDELAADATRVVFIVITTPLGATTGQIANYALIATTENGGSAGSQGAVTTQTAGADTAGVDVVFADGFGSALDIARDGKYSIYAVTGFQVSAAALTVTKTSSVYWDPFNLLVNPKAIPGAIVTYTITVSNGAGGSDATSVSITDSLAAEIAAGHVAFNPLFNDGTGVGCNSAGYGIAVDPGTGTYTCKTNLNDIDGADFGATPNTVTVSGLAITAGQTARIKFQVVVQ